MEEQLGSYSEGVLYSARRGREREIERKRKRERTNPGVLLTLLGNVINYAIPEMGSTEPRT